MAITTSYNLSTLIAESNSSSNTLNTPIAQDSLTLANTGLAHLYQSNPGGFVSQLRVDVRAANGVIIFSKEISTGTGHTDAQLVQTSNNNLLAIWESPNSNASLSNIRYQHIDSTNGNDVGFQGVFSITTSGGWDAAAVGNFTHVAYESNGTIFTTKINANGVQAGITTISGTAAGTLADPVISAQPDGSFAVSWTDDGKMLFRSFDSANVATSTVVTIDSVGNNTLADMTYIGNGQYAVVYVDTQYGGGEIPAREISMTIVNANGTISSGPSLVSQQQSAGGQNETDPSISVMADGTILVTWTHQTNASNGDIYGRLFNSDGSAATVNGSTGHFVINNGAFNDTDSDANYTTNGQFRTTWLDSETDIDGGRTSAQTNKFTRTMTSDGNGDAMYGDAYDDIMFGNGGNDVLWGNGGTNTMSGGIGDDVYLVDGSNDTVIEAANEGNDTVYSFSNNITLAANVEVGVGFRTDIAQVIIGNALDNVLIFNSSFGTNQSQNGTDAGAGNDTVYLQSNASALGGSGNDVIVMSGTNNSAAGGLDNDVYILNADGNTIAEAGNGGTDTVYSYIANTTLSANVEILALITFDTNFVMNGTGNAGNNTIIGSGSANTLVGLGGNDFLIGGGGSDAIFGGTGNDTMQGNVGNDSFIWNDQTEIGDIIQDWIHADDSFAFGAASFGFTSGQSLVLGDSFFEGINPLATNAGPAFLWDTDDTALYYDADGSGSGAAVLVADLQAFSHVDVTDFVMI